MLNKDEAFYITCFRQNEIHSTKILYKFNRLYNDKNVIKTRIINKIKSLLT